MSGGNERVNCPDCGMPVLRKNLPGHYRRLHPGSDPRRKLREAREKPHRGHVLRDLPRSDILGILVVVVAMLVLISAGLLAYSLIHDGRDRVRSPRTIFYTSDDGAVINGTFYPASDEGAGTVYLVHDIGSDRTIWKDYALELRGKGYNVLAIDLRGHGESHINIKSKDIYYDWSGMDHTDFLGFMKDINAAHDWVQGEDIRGDRNTDAGPEGAFVGIGKGGLYVLNQVARMSREKMLSAVIISPTLDCYSLDVPQVAEDWGDVRPIAFIGSEGDPASVLAIDELLKRRPENGRVLEVPGAASGTDLAFKPEVEDIILETIELGWEL